MLVNTFDKLAKEKQEAHLHHAEQFLNALDSQG